MCEAKKALRAEWDREAISDWPNLPVPCFKKALTGFAQSVRAPRWSAWYVSDGRHSARPKLLNNYGSAGAGMVLS
jgi:hypothetical protein